MELTINKNPEHCPICGSRKINCWPVLKDVVKCSECDHMSCSNNSEHITEIVRQGNSVTHKLRDIDIMLVRDDNKNISDVTFYTPSFTVDTKLSSLFVQKFADNSGVIVISSDDEKTVMSIGVSNPVKVAKILEINLNDK